MRVRIEKDDGVLNVIDHPSICTNAMFVLDEPMTLNTGDEFELVDGQWFTVDKQQERHFVGGHWKPHG